MRRMIFLIALMLLVGKMIHAQDGKTIGLSLQQCVQMAVENNIIVSKARVSEFKEWYTK